MLGWEYRTIDISTVAFMEMPRVLAALKDRGWEVSPVQATAGEARLRLGLRRPIRFVPSKGWLWVAG
jgi:hypothetical protein